MAELSVKNFDDDIYAAVKIAAIHKKMTLREYITETLAKSLPAAMYPANATEVPATGRRKP